MVVLDERPLNVSAYSAGIPRLLLSQLRQQAGPYLLLPPVPRTVAARLCTGTRTAAHEAARAEDQVEDLQLGAVLYLTVVSWLAR
jgi:hypothetical protein